MSSIIGNKYDVLNRGIEPKLSFLVNLKSNSAVKCYT